MAFNIIKTVDNKLSTKFVIYSDSRSAIDALHSYSHKNHVVLQIRNLFNKFISVGIQIELCWIPAHIGIRGNELADAAAKSAISSPRIAVKLPATDFITAVKHCVTQSWQDQWNNVLHTNKLKQIKQDVSLWKSSLQPTRQNEVLLTRLRIGHTRLTHGYLMSNPQDPIPMCSTCNVFLTIKHIFNDCAVYARNRKLYFGNNTYDVILAESPAFSFNRILMFLRATGLLNKL